jgi:hypothetical protein
MLLTNELWVKLGPQTTAYMHNNFYDNSWHLLIIQTDREHVIPSVTVSWSDPVGSELLNSSHPDPKYNVSVSGSYILAVKSCSVYAFLYFKVFIVIIDYLPISLKMPKNFSRSLAKILLCTRYASILSFLGLDPNIVWYTVNTVCSLFICT